MSIAKRAGTGGTNRRSPGLARLILIVCTLLIVVAISSGGALTSANAASSSGSASSGGDAHGGTNGGTNGGANDGANSTPPTARNDRFQIREDHNLRVDPRGVLRNDDGKNLSAAKLSSPNHGRLDLRKNGSLLYEPNNNYYGSDSFAYKAKNGEGQSDRARVKISVRAVNDAPHFRMGRDQTLKEDAGLQRVERWARGISSGPSNESRQDLTFKITGNTKPSLFAQRPEVSPGGKLTYKSAKDKSGQATISLRLKDDGGTLRGGRNMSGERSFKIKVSAVDDPLEVSVTNDGPVDEGGGTATITATAQDADSPAGPFTFEFDCDGTFEIGPQPGNTADCTFEDSGQKTVNVRVNDGEGTGSTTVTVNNVAPTATLTNDAPVDEGSPVTVSFSGASDVSNADTSVGFHYEYNCDGSAFGDPADYDSASTDATKQCTFDDEGTYTVRARVVDQDNGASEYTTDVTVDNVAPSVSAPANQSADEGVSDDFDLGSFTDPGDDGPWSVSVDWGDGSPNATFSANSAGDLGQRTHTYATDDTYNVTVTVAEAGTGAPSDSDTYTVTVSNASPSVSAPSDQQVDESVSDDFDLGSFTDPGDDGPWSVSVDWGDGSPNATFSANSAGDLGTQSHTYTDNGSYTVTVTVAEAGAGTPPSGSASFAVTVDNVAPNVDAGSGATIDEGDTFTGGGSFTDPGTADTHTAIVDYGDGSVAQPLSLNADKTFALSHTYTDEGTYTVVVTVTDDDGDSGTDSLSVTVFNVAPTANDQSVTTDEGLAKLITLTGTDVGADSLSFRVTSLPTNGKLYEGDSTSAADEITSGELPYTLSGNQITYQPNSPTFFGSDGFEFTACDDASPPACDADGATVQVTVTQSNDPPTATDDTKTVAEEAALTFPASDLTANDSAGTNEGTQTLTVTQVSNPSNGTVSVDDKGTQDPADDEVTFTPDADYFGPASFEYTVRDNGQTNGADDFKSDTGTVNVTVTEVNDAPTATDDTATTNEDTDLVLQGSNLTTNDTKGPANESGQSLSVNAVGNATNGTVSLSAGQITFDPDADYFGAASFEYTVRDNGQTNGADDFKSDTGSINVTVAAVNDPPDAVNDTATTDEDVAVVIDVKTNDTKGPANESTQTLAVDSITVQPSNGTATVIASGPDADKVSYTPAANYFGPDSFTYRVCDDGQSGNPPANDPRCETAAVSVTVVPVNDNPVADDESFNGANRAIGNTSFVSNDLSDAAPADPSGPQKTITGDILDGDIDVDGPGPLAVLAETNKATNDGGTVTIESDGDFTFHPKAGTSCTDHEDFFDYTLTDQNSTTKPGTPGTDTGRVTIEIQDCVWYVDDDAPNGGDGRSHSPYNTLTSIDGAGGSGDADSAAEKIFLYDGTYSGGLPLENNQSLYTEKHGLVVSDGGAGNVTLEPNDGSGSTLNGGLAAASGNNVQGLNLGTTGSSSVYALSGTSVGTFTMNNVTGGDLNNPAGGAINIGGTGNTLNLQFGTLSSSGGSGNAVSILSASGTVSGQSGTLSNATGTTVNLNGGSLDFTLGGAVSDDTGQLISISNKTSGTTDFNGPVDDNPADGDGGGISLQSNGTALTRFDGGVNLSTGSANAISASNGGTLAIPDPAAASNKIATTTTGTALNVTNTTIGSDDLTFESISAGPSSGSGPTNGIVLNNTGTSGNLSVTGNAGVCTIATPTCSGGTIQNTTGEGISLTNTNNPSFNLMRVLNTAGHGISGTTTSGLSLSNSLIQGAGDADNEAGLFFATVDGTNLTGNSSITNTVVNAPADVGGFIQNYGGNLNLTVSGSTFSGTQKNTPGVVTGDDLLRIISDRTNAGSATITARIIGSTFRNSESDDILANAQSSTGSGGGTMNLTVDGNTFDGNGVFETCDTIGCNSYGIVTQGTQGATIRYTIQNNSIVNHLDAGIAARSDNSSNVQGFIKNNTIGTAGSPRSGSYRDRGIFLASDDSSDFIASVENNVIHSTFFEGISASTTDGTGLSPKMDLTILGNTTPTPADTSGTYLPSINMTSSGNASACARAENNTAQPGRSSAGSIDFLLFRDTATSTATFKLEGLPAPTADASSFVKSKNPASADPVFAVAGKDGSNPSTPQFTGGTCRTPAATPTP